MDAVLDVIYRFGVGIFGLWIYILITIWGSGIGSEFSISRNWRENKNRYLLVIVMLISISLLIQIVPDGGEVIKTMTGLDVAGTLTSFLSLGYFFGSSIKKVVKKNVN